jgi:hypothetical protein
MDDNIVDLNKYKANLPASMGGPKKSQNKLEYGSRSIVGNIYHYLWSKNYLFKTGPQIFLPDTVIYRYG